MAADTATPVAAWPTVDDYRKVERKLGVASEAMDELRGFLSRFSDPVFAPSLREGVEQPRLNDVGLLAIFCGHARLDIESIETELVHLEQIRDALTVDMNLPG